MKRFFALLLLSSLAACSLFDAEPQVDSAPPPGISYRIDKDSGGDPAAKATEYCGRFGKTAKEGKKTEASEGAIASFECS
jgi:hypothetical protein